MDEPWRFYRQAHATATVIPLLVLGGGAALASAVAYAVNRRGSVAVGVLVAIAVVGVVVRTLYVVPQIGVRETDGGLLSQMDGGWLSLTPKRDLVAWEDIEGFVVVSGLFPGQTVRAACRSRGLVRIAVRQGRPMRWTGGETRDIASVLADRTNEVLRARGLDGVVTVSTRARGAT